MSNYNYTKLEQNDDDTVTIEMNNEGNSFSTSGNYSESDRKAAEERMGGLLEKNAAFDEFKKENCTTYNGHLKNSIRLFGKFIKLPPQNVRAAPYTNLPALGFMGFMLYSLYHVYLLYTFFRDNNLKYGCYYMMIIPLPLWLMGACCYLMAMCTHPGKPRKHTTAIDRSPQEEADLMDNAKVTKIGWCEPCNNAKPERTHHCNYCEECVLRMDHHCPWIHNCVGNNNHKVFYLMLHYGKGFGVVTIVALLFADFIIYHRGLEKNAREIQLIVNVISASVVTLWLYALGMEHTKLMWNNRTTLETFAYRKTKSQGIPIYNPYDSGDALLNMNQVLGKTFFDKINPFAKAFASDGHAFLHYPPDEEFLREQEEYKLNGPKVMPASSGCGGCSGSHA